MDDEHLSDREREEEDPPRPDVVEWDWRGGAAAAHAKGDSRKTCTEARTRPSGSAEV
jgi:hypothetical protein